jgi:murein DD-endopeptidase MepM/ murein hydrolase activator NlpD
MDTTHLITSTSRPTWRRRGWRSALAAATGAAVIIVSPTARIDAGSVPAGRACDITGAATHTVAAGDSWFGVATASRVSAAELLVSNEAVASTVLHPGDVLCLPTGAAQLAPTSSQRGCASNYTVVSGDSWYGISRAAGMSLNGLLDANAATANTVLRPGAQVCLPAGTTPLPAGGAKTAGSCVAKRVVAAGESWYAIARSTGVPVDALVAANGVNQSSPIYAGQSLCLPEVGFGRDLPSVLLDAIPVRGACRFANSWQASRDGGRLHVGVDLIAPSGTPVVAAANGTLTRQTTDGARSGNAWWLTTSTGTYYFYAHLSSFSSGLSVGSRVQAGDVIGSVGSTGNAVSPHLHFEIHPKGGGPVNPYASIWMIGGCTFDRRYEQTPLS